MQDYTGTFSRQTIVGIPKNPIYKGQFKHSGVEGKIDSIIHPRIFNQVQRLLESRKKGYEGAKRIFE